MLARRLLTSPLTLRGGQPGQVGELLLVDLVAPPADLAADSRVRPVVGELGAALGELGEVDAVFHLAGVVSGAAEADFDLGLHTNVDGTRGLLEYARRHRVPPVFVFTSSLAMFGSDPAIGPVGVVDDDTQPRPQSSYGIQKFIGEQLVADYARKGFMKGRSVRLMTVSVRPGKPKRRGVQLPVRDHPRAAGGRAFGVPGPPGTRVALSSPRRTLQGIVLAAAASDASWGGLTAMNLPALTTTPCEMAASLDRVAGAGTSDRIDWSEDPVTGTIVRSWPAEFRTPRAGRWACGPRIRSTRSSAPTWPTTRVPDPDPEHRFAVISYSRTSCGHRVTAGASGARSRLRSGPQLRG